MSAYDSDDIKTVFQGINSLVVVRGTKAARIALRCRCKKLCNEFYLGVSEDLPDLLS